MDAEAQRVPKRVWKSALAVRASSETGDRSEDDTNDLIVDQELGQGSGWKSASSRQAKPRSPQHGQGKVAQAAAAAVNAAAGVKVGSRRSYKMFLIALCAITVSSAAFAWFMLSNPRDSLKSASESIKAGEARYSLSKLFGVACLSSAILMCTARCLCPRPLKRQLQRCKRACNVSPPHGRDYALLPTVNHETDINNGRRDSDVNLGSTVTEKVQLVLGFAKDDLAGSWSFEGAAFAASVLCSTENVAELALLKQQADLALREVGMSLYELVYTVFDPESRESVLSHIDSQSAADQDLESRKSSQRAFIISDMDDTLVSTFKDLRFPFNSLYPGVRQFYHQLILSSCGTKSQTAGEKRDTAYLSDWSNAKHQVTFVTARPSWLDAWTRHDLVKHGFETSVALTGSAYSFVTPAMMLGRKVKQCREMRRLFPEGVFFLVGDNGQKDIDLGIELVKHGLVRAVFIHDIFAPLSRGDPELVASGAQQAESPSTTQIAPFGTVAMIEMQQLSPASSDQVLQSRGSARLIRQSVVAGYRGVECDEHGIVLFQSYSGAALAAMGLGLFDARALVNVALASAKDLASMKFTRESQRARQRDVFLRDIARACHYLKDGGLPRGEESTAETPEAPVVAFLHAVLESLNNS